MISKTHLKNIITQFRQYCLNEINGEIVYLDLDNCIDESTLSINGTAIDEKFDSVADIYSKPHDKIVILLAKTPRTLKKILRSTYSAWIHLIGEISFEDLLLLNTIRTTEPKLFDFIHENIEEIRNIPYQFTQTRRDSALEGMQDRITLLFSNESVSIEYLWDLLKYLFPVFGRTPRLQNVSISSPTDYWERYLREDLLPEEIKDQDILKAIRIVKKTPSQPCFNKQRIEELLCENGEFTAKFEIFSKNVFTRSEILTIASNFFDFATSKLGAAAGSTMLDNSIPGFIPLVREFVNLPPFDSNEIVEYYSWVSNEINIALRRSIKFADSIFEYWRTPMVERDICPEEVKKLRHEMTEMFRSLFQDNPGKFCECLDPEYPYSSHHFVKLYSAEKYGGNEFNATEWGWFYQMILDAAEINPQTIVPQIAVLFVKEERVPRLGFNYTFSLEEAENIYDREISKLMKALSQTIEIDAFDDREKNLIDCAQTEARKWLSRLVKNEK